MHERDSTCPSNLPFLSFILLVHSSHLPPFSPCIPFIPFANLPFSFFSLDTRVYLVPYILSPTTFSPSLPSSYSLCFSLSLSYHTFRNRHLRRQRKIQPKGTRKQHTPFTIYHGHSLVPDHTPHHLNYVSSDKTSEHFPTKTESNCDSRLIFKFSSHSLPTPWTGSLSRACPGSPSPLQRKHKYPGPTPPPPRSPPLSPPLTPAPPHPHHHRYYPQPHPPPLGILTPETNTAPSHITPTSLIISAQQAHLLDWEHIWPPLPQLLYPTRTLTTPDLPRLAHDHPLPPYSSNTTPFLHPHPQPPTTSAAIRPPGQVQKNRNIHKTHKNPTTRRSHPGLPLLDRQGLPLHLDIGRPDPHHRNCTATTTSTTTTSLVRPISIATRMMPTLGLDPRLIRNIRTLGTVTTVSISG